MEYVEGDTLAGLLEHAIARNVVLPPSIGLRIGLDMLAGLHAAHELVDEKGRPLNLIHRDVSPQNVLIGIDGIAKITDFGIARATSRLTYTREGQLKGKLAYMAPEYIQRDHEIDRRADVFSAAIVLWETLAMMRLFKAETDAATLARILGTHPPRLHELAPRIPEKLGRVVMRGLERTKTARYESCAQFAEALEDAATGSVRPASAGELAKFVNHLLGDAVEQQRTDVRSCAANFDTYRAPQPSRTALDVSRDFPSVYTSRVNQRETTTSISTSRDVYRTSRPASSIPRKTLVALSTLSLAVLGLGGGIGAYFGMKAQALPTTVAQAASFTPPPIELPMAARDPVGPSAAPNEAALNTAPKAPVNTSAFPPSTASSSLATVSAATEREPRSSRRGVVVHRRTSRSTPKSSPLKVPLDTTTTPKNPYR
jgi:serine/threonine-protein kinase